MANGKRKMIQLGFFFVYVLQTLSLFRTLEDGQKAKASNPNPKHNDFTIKKTN